MLNEGMLSRALTIDTLDPYLGYTVAENEMTEHSAESLEMGFQKIASLVGKAGTIVKSYN